MTFLPDISIVKRKSVKLMGIVLRTNMEKCSSDCPELWKRFMPRMKEVAERGARYDESYGVCAMVDPETGIFDYWAAVPMPQGISAPEGMQTFEIAAGSFARCPVPSLSALQSAYDYLCLDWPQTQDTYSLDAGRPCFELYGKNFQENGSLEVYFPVKAV